MHHVPPHLPPTMRAGRILGPHRAVVQTVPVPTPSAGEVLIEVARAGICGTDLHILDGSYDLARFPMTPGHELSGTIVALGEGVRHSKVGARVTVDPNLPCGRCPECQRGRANQCHDLDIIGVRRDGAFARWMVAPESSVVAIGDLTFEEGALAEPLACVAWGLERIRIHPGDQALVLGAGPMGGLLLQAVKATGAARVAVVDVAPARLELARSLGADLAVHPAQTAALQAFAPHGFDLIIEATGIPTVLEANLQHARAGGTIWVFGVAPAGVPARIPPYELFRRDLTITGSFALHRTAPQAVAMLQGGSINVRPLVTHVLDIERFEDGMRLMREDPTRMKIQFRFHPDDTETNGNRQA